MLTQKVNKNDQNNSPKSSHFNFVREVKQKIKGKYDKNIIYSEFKDHQQSSYSDLQTQYQQSDHSFDKVKQSKIQSILSRTQISSNDHQQQPLTIQKEASTHTKNQTKKQINKNAIQQKSLRKLRKKLFSSFKLDVQSIAYQYHLSALNDSFFELNLDSYRNHLIKRILQAKNNKRKSFNLKYDQKEKEDKFIIGAKCICGKIYRKYANFKKHVQLKHYNQIPKGSILNFPQLQKYHYEKIDKYYKKEQFQSIKVAKDLTKLVSIKILKKLHQQLNQFIKSHQLKQFKIKQVDSQEIEEKIRKQIFKINQDYFQIHKCNIKNQLKFMSLIKYVSIFCFNFKIFVQNEKDATNIAIPIAQLILLNWIRWSKNNFNKAIQQYEADSKNCLFVEFDKQEFQKTKEIYLIPYLIKCYLKEQKSKSNIFQMINTLLENFYQFLKQLKQLDFIFSI